MLRNTGFVWILAVALAGLGCGKGTHIVYLEDEVPLAAPLEGATGQQDNLPGAEKDDPPSRVARVSYVNGQVSVQPGGVDDWAPANLNLPLKGGDSLWSAPNSRAELQVGPTGLRASNNTSFQLVRVEDSAFQVGLDQGTLMLHLLPGGARDAVEVDTPAGAITLGTAGTYRVEMDPTKPEGSLTVRSGHADVTLEGEVIPVGPGKRVRLTGGDEPGFQVEAAPAPDGFETWSDARDLHEANALGNHKVGRGFIGAGDLDGAGVWSANSDYGDVWTPRVAPGWAPYRDGRWAWVEPWGWTWVDDAPWGFTTSHYGRWAYLGGTWSWVPKSSLNAAGRPVYAPALVGFAGQPAGPRQDKPISGGGVAWFPLGPRDPYTPAYPVSRSYFVRLNPGFNPDRIPRSGSWANQSVPGAVTVVPRATFTSFAPVATARVPMGDPRFFRSAPVGPAPALPPTLRSVTAGSNPLVPRPPGELGARPWLARTALPAQPLPFSVRENALRASQGRPLGAAGLSNLRRQGAFLAPNRTFHGATMRNADAPLRNRNAEAAASRLGQVPPRREGSMYSPTRKVEPWELKGGEHQGRDQRPGPEEREREAASRRAEARRGAQGENRPARAQRPAAAGGGARTRAATSKARPSASPKSSGSRGGGRRK